MTSKIHASQLLGILVFLTGLPHALSAPAKRISFNNDIRPILLKNCTACHGGVKQAGNVSFLYRHQALGKVSAAVEGPDAFRIDHRRSCRLSTLDISSGYRIHL